MAEELAENVAEKLEENPVENNVENPVEENPEGKLEEKVEVEEKVEENLVVEEKIEEKVEDIPVKEVLGPIAMIGTKFVSMKGGEMEDKEIALESDGKIIALLFAAFWCPACRRFMLKMRRLLKKMIQEDLNPVQFIYISLDSTESIFQNNLKKVPFLTAVPYDSEEKANLIEKFMVEGLPRMVVLTTKGGLITENGVNDVLNNYKNPKKLFEKWEKLSAFVEENKPDEDEDYYNEDYEELPDSDAEEDAEEDAE